MALFRSGQSGLNKYKNQTIEKNRFLSLITFNECPHYLAFNLLFLN